MRRAPPPFARTASRQRRTPAAFGGRARGVALLVVLVFTLALTGIALVSARLALGGEGLARNQLDHQVARQAAEAALRDAERDIMLPANYVPSASAVPACARDAERPVQDKEAVLGTAACLRGHCLLNEKEMGKVSFGAATSTTEGEVWWPVARGGRWNNDLSTKPSPGSNKNCLTFTGAVPLGTFTGAQPIPAVAQQPEYLLERMRRGKQLLFRITARGFGYRQGTEVVLQSYFVVPEL